MVILNFNTEDVEPSGFEPLPEGEYKVILQSADGPIETANKTGSYLKLKFQVIEGEFKNRIVFENLNLWRTGNTEKDKTTIRIAQSRLRDLCLAVGKTRIKDTMELVNKPLIVRLKVRDSGGNFGLQNEIVAHRALDNGSTPGGVVKPAPPVKSASLETTNKMPWE